MKNWLTTALACLIFSFAQSQTLGHSVINAGGGSSQKGYYYFEWSIGEAPLITLMEARNNSISITNGFIQPYLLFPGNHNPNNNFNNNEVRVFPNPATEYAEVNLFTDQKGKILLYAYTALGQQIFSKEIVGNGVDIIERIPVTNWAAGVYSLYIELIPAQGYTGKSSMYKIIKSH